MKNNLLFLFAIPVPLIFFNHTYIWFCSSVIWVFFELGGTTAQAWFRMWVHHR